LGSVGSAVPAGRAGDRSVTVIVPRDGLAAYVPDVAQARRLVASGVVHLYAGVLEGTGFVGPLVVPGRTACGECLALALADRDPALPRVLAQLRSGRQPAVPACDVALATAVAGIAAGHVLARLDGRVPPSAGARVELSQARLSTYVRALPPDPRCECGAAARQAAAAGAGAGAAGARWECAGAGAGAGRGDGAGADKGDGGDAAAGPEEGSAGTRGGLRGGARAGGGTMAMEPTGNEGAHV
jgi:bacteriocin biosynthesis cyclodehydratase domain-containing protein